MQGALVTVFGGSGFLGRYVVKALTKRGARVRIAMRRPHLGHELRVLGDVGQVQLVQANVRYPESVAAAVQGSDYVVNLVGLLFEKGSQTFEGVQARGAAAVAEAAAKAGAKGLVHVSAIGASTKIHSAYGRTKGLAEAAVRKAFPQAVILRPSIVFGAEDQFFNRFAEMARFTPALPLIGGGKTKMQPVFVGDVAEAVAAGLENPQAQGRTFELGGPRVYSFKQLLDFTLTTIERQRGFAPLPFFLAKPLGALTDLAFRLNPLMAPPLTGDQVEMLKRDSIVGASGEPNIGTIADLGVTNLETVESIVPTYLWRFRPYGQFQTKQPV